MNSSNVQVIYVGTHELRVEGDTMELTAHGPFLGNDMREMRVLIAKYKREHGQVFVIYDARQCTGFDSDARRVAFQLRDEQTDANLRVIYGMSFSIRVLLNMVLRAQTILSKRYIGMYFIDSESEARTLFELKRAKLRAEFKAAKSL